MHCLLVSEYWKENLCVLPGMILFHSWFWRQKPILNAGFQTIPLDYQLLTGFPVLILTLLPNLNKYKCNWVDFVHVFPGIFIWKTFIVYFRFVSLVCPTLHKNCKLFNSHLRRAECSMSENYYLLWLDYLNAL